MMLLMMMMIEVKSSREPCWPCWRPSCPQQAQMAGFEKNESPGTTGSLGNQILGVSLRYLWVDEKVPILSLTDFQVVWGAGLKWRGQALPIRSRPIQNVWMCHSSRPMEPQILVIYKCQIEAMLSPQFWATPTYQPLMVGHPVTQVPCGVSEFTKALGRATFG